MKATADVGIGACAYKQNLLKVDDAVHSTSRVGSDSTADYCETTCHFRRRF